MPRPQYGQQFQQLPSATRRDLTPESALEQDIQTGRQQIQDKYALQWKEATRGAPYVGVNKTNRMLREIDTKAKQEMLQFNQQARQQLTQLQNVDRLAQQGMITNPDEIKARMTFGADVAKQMFPTPEKPPVEKPPMQQFADLDIYSHRISDELEWFKEDKPSRLPKALGLVSPLAGAISVYRGQRKPKRKVLMYDPATDDHTRKAEPEEIARYDMLRQEEKDIVQRKSELYGQLSIGRGRVQPGTKGGTFGDKIAESVKPRQTTKQQPTATQLRQRGTREAYNKGIQLGYWR